ncbi:UNVERIFIED_CONTAM: hypothetical protein HDU68_007473 [Siphonaria sp. JEL0065]|nr:hypothetical protein HDU68_007473 [Siphonaria sp. JEL0065]
MPLAQSHPKPPPLRSFSDGPPPPATTPSATAKAGTLRQPLSVRARMNSNPSSVTTTSSHSQSRERESERERPERSHSRSRSRIPLLTTNYTSQPQTYFNNNNPTRSAQSPSRRPRTPNANLISPLAATPVHQRQPRSRTPVSPPITSQPRAAHSPHRNQSSNNRSRPMSPPSTTASGNNRFRSPSHNRDRTSNSSAETVVSPLSPFSPTSPVSPGGANSSSRAGLHYQHPSSRQFSSDSASGTAAMTLDGVGPGSRPASRGRRRNSMDKERIGLQQQHNQPESRPGSRAGSRSRERARQQQPIQFSDDLNQMFGATVISQK